MRVGRIYKIVAGQSNECYVGSTFDELRYRFKNHKNAFRNNSKRQCLSFTLFEKYGIENCSIMLIKEYEVEDHRHLEVYETLWIKKLKSINKMEPCGGILTKIKQKQYREANRKTLCERSKAYHEKNKRIINEKRKEYSKQYYEANKERYKQYREERKEKLSEYKKGYHEVNKEAIAQKRKEKVTCECGCVISMWSMYAHKKSQRHMDLINAKTQ